MKNMHRSVVIVFTFLGLLFILTPGCKKDDKNQSETVKDIDGNVYHTVTIGTQVWMAENLKTITLNDGTSIPRVENNATWPTFNLPAYCWYNNNEATKTTYGALYNWYTVNTGKLAPKGWHVPTDADWSTLITFLGGNTVAGGKLKEKGTTHWQTPNEGATNESGFTFLPGGYRSATSNSDGHYGEINLSGSCWSSTHLKLNTQVAKSLFVINSGSFISFNLYDFHWGFSVRCIKD